MPTETDADDPSNLDHTDRGPVFCALSWVLAGLAFLFIVLRVYCKLISRRRLWWDDWTLIVAFATIIVTDAVTTVLIRDYGLGRHGWDLKPGDTVRFLLLLSSRATITITAVVLTKTAFAVTLLRLTEGAVYKFVWFIIVSMNILMGFSAAVPWIQCSPLAKGWDPSIPGTCWAPGVGTKIWIGTGAYSALMDFTLAGLPWTFLWSLRIQKKEKVGIAVAMSMGVIAGVVAIVKCCKLPYLNSPDPYNAAELYMWDISESTAATVAACIPSLRVLIRDGKELSSSGRFFSFMLTPVTGSSKEQSQVRRLASHDPVVRPGTEELVWRDDSAR